MKAKGDHGIVGSVQTRTCFAVLFFGAIVGCTSILGDFEVSDGPPTTTNPETGAPCTQCGANCVDTSTDSANCGACGTACVGGQMCKASSCSCATGQAFCQGTCSPGSRQRCGANCVACAVNQICGDGCVPAPPPRIRPLPHYVVGWRGPTGQPLQIEVENTNTPNVVYECRTAPKSLFTPTVPAWRPCDGAQGAGTIHRPTEAPGIPEGTYRTEHRYRNDDFTSEVVGIDYYVHHAIDNVASCPRPGQAADGPHFSDDQYFAVAQAFSATNAALFPTSATFPMENPMPGPADQMILRAPRIKIFFRGVQRSPGMRFNAGNAGGEHGWPVNGGNYQFEDGSIRHEWRMNMNRTLVLVKRAYVRRSTHARPGMPGTVMPLNNFTTSDCKQTIRFGSRQGQGYGPANAGRGIRDVECEAFVLNASGAGVCMMPGPGGMAPQVVPFDLHPAPLGGTIGLNNVNVTAGSTTLSAPAGTFSAADVNSYIMLPNSNVRDGFRWYRITTFQNSSPQLIQLNEAPINRTLGGFLSGPHTYRKAPAMLAPELVTESGYAKIHFGPSHEYNPNVRAGTSPSPGSKCYTPGCATSGAPWLTYLPP